MGIMRNIERELRELKGLPRTALAGLAIAGMLWTPAAEAEEGPATTQLSEEQVWPDTPYRAMGGLRETRKREQQIREDFRRPRVDLDCTFFASQAFNQEPDHFTTRMAAMCAMLSAYKQAVIATNAARFRADRAEDGANPYRPALPDRVTAMPGATDTGKYLIAREIGLIDALAD